MSLIINNSSKTFDTILFKTVELQFTENTAKKIFKASTVIRDISYQIKNVYLTLDPSIKPMTLLLYTTESIDDIQIYPIYNNTKFNNFNNNTEATIKYAIKNTTINKGLYTINVVQLSEYNNIDYIDLIIVVNSNSRNIRLIGTVPRIYDLPTLEVYYKVILCYFCVLPIVVDYTVPIDNNSKIIQPDFYRYIVLQYPMVVGEDLQTISYVCFDPFTSGYNINYYIGFIQDLNVGLNHRFTKYTTSVSLLYTLNTLQKLLLNSYRVQYTLIFKTLLTSNLDIDITLNSTSFNVKNDIKCTILGKDSIRIIQSNITEYMTTLNHPLLQSSFTNYIPISTDMLNINNYIFCYNYILDLPELNRMYSSIADDYAELTPISLITYFKKVFLVQFDVLNDFLFFVTFKYNLLYYSIIETRYQGKIETEQVNLQELFKNTYRLAADHTYKSFFIQFIDPSDVLFTYLSENNKAGSNQNVEEAFDSEEDEEDEEDEEGYENTANSNDTDVKLNDLLVQAQDEYGNDPYIPLNDIPNIDNNNSNNSNTNTNNITDNITYKPLTVPNNIINNINLRLLTYPSKPIDLKLNSILTLEFKNLFLDIEYIAQLAALPQYKIKLLLITSSAVSYIWSTIVDKNSAIHTSKSTLEYIANTKSANTFETEVTNSLLLTNFLDITGKVIETDTNTYSIRSDTIVLNIPNPLLDKKLAQKEFASGHENLYIYLHGLDENFENNPKYVADVYYMNRQEELYSNYKAMMIDKYVASVNTIDLVKVAINILVILNQTDYKVLLKLYRYIVKETTKYFKLDLRLRFKKVQQPTNVDIIPKWLTEDTEELFKKNSAITLSNSIELEYKQVVKNNKAATREYKKYLEMYYESMKTIKAKFNDTKYSFDSLRLKVANKSKPTLKRTYKEIVEDLLVYFNIQLPMASIISANNILSIFFYLVGLSNTTINLEENYLFDFISIVKPIGTFNIYLEISSELFYTTQYIQLDLVTCRASIDESWDLERILILTDTIILNIVAIASSELIILPFQVITYAQFKNLPNLSKYINKIPEASSIIYSLSVPFHFISKVIFLFMGIDNYIHCKALIDITQRN